MHTQPTRQVFILSSGNGIQCRQQVSDVYQSVVLFRSFFPQDFWAVHDRSDASASLSDDNTHDCKYTPHTSLCIYTHITHAHTRVYTHAHTCMHTPHTHVRTHTHTHTHTRTHARTHARTHTHTHTHVATPWNEPNLCTSSRTWQFPPRNQFNMRTSRSTGFPSIPRSLTYLIKHLLYIASITVPTKAPPSIHTSHTCIPRQALALIQPIMATWQRQKGLSTHLFHQLG